MVCHEVGPSAVAELACLGGRSTSTGMRQSVTMTQDAAEWGVHEVRTASGAAWHVPAGSSVRVVDVEGGQVADVFMVDEEDVTDGLSNGRTFDYNGTVALTVRATLYSSRSRALATIVEDDVGRHDFLYAPCSQEMYEIQYGVIAAHPNCYDNLTQALWGFGVPSARVTVAFNAFMSTRRPRRSHPRRPRGTASGLNDVLLAAVAFAALGAIAGLAFGPDPAIQPPPIPAPGELSAQVGPHPSTTPSDRTGIVIATDFLAHHPELAP